MLCEFSGRDFARFHIRLIEAVDADYRAGNGGCDLPSEELLAEIVFVENVDSDDRLARFFESFDLGILHRIGSVPQADVHEEPVLAIDIWRAEFFAINWNDSFSFFASRFGE